MKEMPDFVNCLARLEWCGFTLSCVWILGCGVSQQMYFRGDLGTCKEREKEQSDRERKRWSPPEWQEAAIHLETKMKTSASLRMHIFQVKIPHPGSQILPPIFFFSFGEKNATVLQRSLFFLFSPVWPWSKQRQVISLGSCWRRNHDFTVLSRTRTSQFTEQNELPGQTLTFKGATTRCGAAWIFLLSKYNHDCGGIRAGRKRPTPSRSASRISSVMMFSVHDREYRER